MCVFLTILKKGKKHLSECFLFLRHAGVGGTDSGVEILWNPLFFFLMLWLIALMGSLFGSRGGRGVEGVALYSYAVIVVEEG